MRWPKQDFLQWCPPDESLRDTAVGEPSGAPSPVLGAGAAVVQFLGCARLFVTPWTAAHQASLSFTISQSLLKLMSIESVMLSNHLIFCCPLLLLPSTLPKISAFSNESALHNRWPKYWSFSFSISTSNEYSELTLFRIDWFDFWFTSEVQETNVSL